jgi:hypothetical protein
MTAVLDILAWESQRMKVLKSEAAMKDLSRWLGQ